MNEFLQQIGEAALPVLCLLITAGGGYLVALLKKYTAQLQQKNKIDTVDKYINIACDAVAQAVTYTAQTFVDALKAEGTFTKEKQIEAFNIAKDKALNILGEAVIDILDEIFDDTEAWLDTKIEQACRELKETAEKGGTKNVD